MAYKHPPITMKSHIFPLMTIVAMLLCAISCSKDSDEVKPKATLDKTTITLYASEEAKLTYTGQACVWSSDNELVAKVDNGVVTAKHVGTTTIHANDLTCQVTVLPKYTTYIEPCIYWGASKSIVKSYMSGYTLKGEETNGLAYLGKGNVYSYAYIFENGGLKTSGFVVTLLNALNISDFLLERYWVIEMKENSDGTLKSYLGSVDLKTYIVLTIDKKQVLVTYMSAESIKASATKSASSMDNSQLLREEIEEYLNKTF